MTDLRGSFELRQPFKTLAVVLQNLEKRIPAGLAQLAVKRYESIDWVEK
jgi:hypothetical protein